MNETPSAAVLTVEEYGSLPHDGPPTELVRGRVVTLPFGTMGHGVLCSNLLEHLMRSSPDPLRGRLLIGRPGFVTTEVPATVRGPDLIVLAEGTSTADLGDWVREPPALIVEVQDRHETRAELEEKAREYLTAGVGEVWVLDGPTRQLRVHRSPAEEPLVLRETDELTSPHLPGFACEVADLLAVG